MFDQVRFERVTDSPKPSSDYWLRVFKCLINNHTKLPVFSHRLKLSTFQLLPWHKSKLEQYDPLLWSLQCRKDQLEYNQTRESRDGSSDSPKEIGRIKMIGGIEWWPIIIHFPPIIVCWTAVFISLLYGVLCMNNVFISFSWLSINTQNFMKCLLKDHS